MFPKVRRSRVRDVHEHAVRGIDVALGKVDAEGDREGLLVERRGCTTLREWGRGREGSTLLPSVRDARARFVDGSGLVARAERGGAGDGEVEEDDEGEEWG